MIRVRDLWAYMLEEGAYMLVAGPIYRSLGHMNSVSVGHMYVFTGLKSIFTGG